MTTIKKTDPVAFFHEHAGWSHDPKVETSAQGRQRTAERLASAESWSRDVGMRFDWREEEYPDRSGIDHDGPMWECCAYLNGEMIEAFGGIDLAARGTPYTHPYARVIEAEMAYSAMP